ncbi:MAG TPA: TonB-dependent receptor [Acidobacteriota bacterium]
MSKDLGIPNTNKGTFETTGSFLTGGFGNGFTEFAGDGGPFIVRSTNLYFADSVTVVKASHTLKAGTEIRPRFLETIDGGRSGFLKGALNYGDNNTGNAQADMLLGTFAPQAQSGTVPGGLFHPRQQEYGFFVQDDWKVSPKLMLNLGLRYDLFTPPTEKDGRFGNFDPKVGRVIVAGGKGDSLVSTDKNNWGPRAGFAYAINKDMVIRGGYALLYTVEGNEYPPLLRNVPFTNQVFYNNFGGAPSTFSFTTGPPVAPIGDPARVTTDFAVYSVETHTTTPGIQQWNLTYQWGFARDYSFDIGYVATRGKHLLATRNLGNQGQGLGLARNFEGKVFDTDKIYENRASSHYDSMQIQVQKRESHGLIGSVAYTWSHNIDESTGEFGGLGDFRGSSGGPIDPFCFRCERGNSSLDVRHLMAARLLYDLPFGKGRAFELSGPVDKILGGWQTNFIFTARTGFPFTVSYHDATTDLDTRPDQIGDPFQGVPAGLFLNPKAFGPAKRTVTNLAGKNLAVGNVGRNTFTGPGYFRTDFSVLKKTKLTEAAEMHFGMEFFNLFNQVHVLTPNSGIDLNNPNNGFGKFFYALPPRTIQYRLKFVF